MWAIEFNSFYSGFAQSGDNPFTDSGKADKDIELNKKFPNYFPSFSFSKVATQSAGSSAASALPAWTTRF